MEEEAFTPELISEVIYNELPVGACTLKLLPYSPDMDNDSASFLFEILITIYMEGTMDAPRLRKMLKEKRIIEETNNKSLDLLTINLNILETCESWIKSLGFLMFIEEYNVIDYNIDKSEYCKIILKNDPNFKNFFRHKKVDKPYHFISFANYKPTDKLENIKALFYKPIINKSEKEKVYTIKFKPLILDSRCGSNI